MNEHLNSPSRRIRVLFLNSRDQLAADVAVHVTIARALDRARVGVVVATSAFEAPGASAATAFGRIADLTLLKVDLGRPVSEQFGFARARALAHIGLGTLTLARLALVARRKHIDLIHVTDRPRDLIFGLLLARASGAAYVVHAHTSYYVHDRSTVIDWLLHRADALIGVSRFTAGTYVDAAGLRPAQVYAVHNAVDTELFRPGCSTYDQRTVRSRWNIAPDVPLIGCVARLSRWKGQAELLDALVIVRRTVPSAHVLFAGTNTDVAPDGDGTFFEYLQRRVAELGLTSAVTFANFIDHEQMPPVFGALDVLAHPAHEEPFGLAIIEAMSSGKAVVAVSEGGIPEIIRDGIDGLLVPRQSPEALAASLLRVLQDDALRARLGLAARARVLERFTPQHQADAITAVYAQTLASRRQSRASRALSAAEYHEGMAHTVVSGTRDHRTRGADVLTTGGTAVTSPIEGADTRGKVYVDMRSGDIPHVEPTCATVEEKRMSAQLYLVNPPPLKGRSNERSQSGGLGVSRKLKPFEKSYVDVLPHDFLYQAAVAERAGHRVKFVDLILENIFEHAQAVTFVRDVVAKGRQENPDAPLWFGVRLSIPSLHSDLRMANMLKAAFPHAHVYLFGNVIMTTYRHWIAEAEVDYVLYGEPEAIIEELLSAEAPASVSGVIHVASYVPIEKPGLFDQMSSSLYRQWRQMRDLSSLPRAAWHLLELGRYAPEGRLSELGISLPASRGCFMPCTMCAYNLHEGRAMRFRTPDEVLDEIEFLHRTYGIHYIRFRDPNFSANKPHLRAIAQGLLDRHLPIEAASELSLELLDRDLLELMYRAGIRTILTGVESDDPSCMASIGQHVKINRILEGKLRLCNELGIKVYTFLLIGSPEETWHSVRRTFSFARKLGSESTMTIMTPFPGTPMYWRALREGLLVKGQEMTYESWNSYTATMRTYKMSLRDLRLARLWARLETYIPYTWKQMQNATTLKQKARTVVRLVPRVVALGGLRVYAAWRLHQEEREDPTLRTSAQTTEAAPAAQPSEGIAVTVPAFKTPGKPVTIPVRTV